MPQNNIGIPPVTKFKHILANRSRGTKKKSKYYLGSVPDDLSATPIKDPELQILQVLSRSYEWPTF